MSFRYPKTLKYIGLFFWAIAIFLNPLCIQWIFVKDGNITDIHKIEGIFIGEVIAGFCGTLVLLQYKHWDKQTIMRIVKFFMVVFVGWLVVEGTSWIAIRLFFSNDYYRFPHFSNDQIQSKRVYDEVESDGNLGYVLKKNISLREQKMFTNGRSIYDVTYTTDAYRRRVVGQTYIPENKHLILFGCSFAFGEGLNDEDTLQYHLSQDLPEFNIYNYAVHGYGPQQMLALLESNKLPEEVQSNKGVAVYVLLLPSALDRLVGSFETPWVYDFPYYRLDEQNRVVRKGNFVTDRTLQTYVYRQINRMRDTSPFLQLLAVSTPISHRDVVLFYKVVERAKQLYEQQFQGKFYVLLHPMSQKSRETEEIKQLFMQNNIPILEYPEELRNNDDIIVGDGHPIGKVNLKLSQYISSFIKQE